MRAMLAAFSAGIIAGAWQLAPLPTFIAAALWFCVCVLLLSRLPLKPESSVLLRRSLALLAALALGLAWHSLWAHWALGQRLANDFSRDTRWVTGRVISIPAREALASRFLFRVDQGPAELQGRHLLLRDYSERQLRGGEHWLLPLRLRAPRGLANPGGFDYEAWLLAEGIDGLGYVREEAGLQRLRASSISVSSLRQFLYERLQTLSARSELGQQVLPALLLGHRAQLDADFQSKLEQTGTNHLFVISGIHIGLVSMLSYGLLRRLLPWLLPLPPQQPVQRLAAWAAIAMAIFYSMLAGFSLPTQRALVMISAFMLGRLLGRNFNLLFRFLLALTLVLLLNPLAAMSAGFWLSFTAVAGLMWFVESAQGNRWRELLRAQLVVYLVLMLPLLFWMGQVSLIAPLVNLFAIPVLGFLLLPLAFSGLGLGMLWPAGGALLLQLANTLLALLMMALGWLGSLLPMLDSALPAFQGLALLLVLLMSALAVLLMLLPVPWSLRAPVPLLLLPLLLGPAPQKPEPNLLVHVLDVGQGLAIVLQQGQYSMLYDTGARIEGGVDMASSVLLPFFRQQQIRELSLLLLSHNDNDHAGGLPVILAAMPVAKIMASDPRIPAEQTLGRSIEPCQAGQRLSLGQAELQLLHPGPGEFRGENNDNSCVLQLRFGRHRVLLSGDISRAVEYPLVQTWGDALASQLLIAPHHGSATSSSFPFIKTVRPQWVVYSAGCHNRFSHPAAEVDRRYGLLGVGRLNTATSGLISFSLDGSGGALQPERYRQLKRRYWRSQNSEDCR